ncbi:MAG: hypothetical protein ACKERG_04390 [Candidatus Hodgkinia cicadicola]
MAAKSLVAFGFKSRRLQRVSGKRRRRGRQDEVGNWMEKLSSRLLAA